VSATVKSKAVPGSVCVCVCVCVCVPVSCLLCGTADVNRTKKMKGRESRKKSHVKKRAEEKVTEEGEFTVSVGVCVCVCVCACVL